MVAEDDADSRDALQTLLELDGYRVDAAADGPGAVALARSMAPDIALIDIGLPGVDGYEVARQIRAEAAGRRIVLVALTGWAQPEHRQRAVEAGFDAHLVKPVDPQQLTRVLEQLAPGGRLTP
jgi:CheY-like chemotaxis protein